VMLFILVGKVNKRDAICQIGSAEMVSDKSKLGFYLLLSPLFVWLMTLIILPHIGMFFVSISEKVGVRQYEYGLGNYAVFFNEPLYWNTFARTAYMSIFATALTLLIGFPIAYYIAKLTRGRTKTTLFLMCLIPFWVSELVRTFGWMILLRETGVVSSFLQYIGVLNGPMEFLYNDGAIMIGLVYTSMLFMVVPLVSTLDSLDDSLIEAGYDLGGNGYTILREIIIPHAMPGIVSGCIVVFMLSLGNYLTPILLGGKDSLWFTDLIYSQFITRFNWELGSAFGFLLLGLSSLIVFVGLKLSRQSLSETMGR
jgi:spermidine/putrescine transport system permease protein